MIEGTITLHVNHARVREALKRNGGDLDLFDACRGFHDNAGAASQVRRMHCPACGAADASLRLERHDGGVEWQVRCGCVAVNTDGQIVALSGRYEQQEGPR